jgi:hypothetical protein
MILALRPDWRVGSHNGTLQNGSFTKWYVLQYGTCYKMVHVTTWYVLQNNLCYKTVRVTKQYMLQSGMCYKMAHVCVTKWYICKIVHVTKWYALQKGTSQNCASQNGTCY